ncbi:TIGR02757 family protein [soil metagenome]
MDTPTLNQKEAIRIKALLDAKLEQYNQPSFVELDPISIPHRYSKTEDIEVMGFLAAVLAWGQRKTIINKCLELERLFHGAPHDFMLNHTDNDLKSLTEFKHRTFNATDLLYFVAFLKHHYQQHRSLETAFSKHLTTGDDHVGKALAGFHTYFFSLEDAPHRTKKHIPTPHKGSSCKRLNMYLRWMVRKDANGVDFGLWKDIKPAQLLCPLDVHVERVARKLGLITQKQTNFNAVLELTANLKMFDAKDPVKYDLALFGMGVVEGR